MTAPPSLPSESTPERWLSALATVMARVTANAEQEGVLSALTSGLVEEFGAGYARVWLYDPADDAMHAVATAGDVSDPVRTVSLIPVRAPLTPVARAIVEQRQVIVLNQIGPDSGIRDLDWLRQVGLSAFAGFPLIVADRLLGLMAVYFRAPVPDPARDALVVLAQQAALALEHARLLDQSHTLQAITAELASAEDVADLLQGLVRRTMVALAADGCAVWLLDELSNRLVAAAAEGLDDTFLERVQRLLDDADERAGAAFQEIQRTGRPLFSRDDQARAHETKDLMAQALADEGIVSALRLPLFAPGGDVVGMLTLYHRRERVYSAGEVALAQTFTDQIAVALHNARLTEWEEESRRTGERRLARLQALTEITGHLLASTDVEGVLQVVVKAGSRLCGTPGAMVALIDDDQRYIRLAAVYGEYSGMADVMADGVELTEEFLTRSASGDALRTGEVALAEDYTTWPASPTRDSTLAAGVRGFMVAPLRANGRSIGLLSMGGPQPRVFTPEDVTMAEALADQAALAIEHARLVRRSQDAAVLDERARLARDLHDSVTQSIFSLGMLAKAAQTQHARRTAGLGTTLQRIADLAQDALKEMRALLFELQPSALAEEGLAPALDKLVTGFRARVNVPVTLQGTPRVRLAPAAETAIFRIVQEAVANATKHAKASEIAIALAVDGGWLVVTVSDDGGGFDAAAAAVATAGGLQGGMGMRTMRERAAEAGIHLRIDSAPGAGTVVTLEARVPAAKEPATARR